MKWIENKKEKKITFSLILTGTKKASLVAWPGGLFSPALVPDLRTGTKGGTFSPDLLVPAPEPGQKAL
jgi:hypothetical protein